MTVSTNLEKLADEIHKLAEEVSTLEVDLEPILLPGGVAGLDGSPQEEESTTARIITTLTQDVEIIRAHILRIKNGLDL